MNKWEKLPEEIKQKMFEKQVEQGNKRNPKVFEDFSKGRSGGGFNWSHTSENSEFWDQVLTIQILIFFSIVIQKIILLHV